MIDWAEVRKLATPVIQHFEGCHLTSYVLKGEKQGTIGWGQAFPLEQHPKTITQAEADRLFENTLLAKETKLRKEIPAAVLEKLSVPCLAAILSFRYNMKETTWLSEKCNTRKALVAGNMPEFIRRHGQWVNGQAGPLAGLSRRRRVERDLMAGVSLAEIKKANWHQGEY